MKSYSERAFMAAFVVDPDLFRSLLITDHQIALVRRVQSQPGFTARDLADEKKITISNASQQLVKLWRMGWLSRKQETDATGGIYYTYVAVHWIGE